MAEYNVSRNTVRHAVDLLVNDGLVHKEHGQGSFVIADPLEIKCRIDTVVEHCELLRRAGFDANIKHIRTSSVVPSAEMQSKLKIPKGEEVVCFEKLFYADGVPAIYARDYVPKSNLNKEFDVEGHGSAFFRFLERQTGYNVEVILSDITPVNSNEFISEQLKIRHQEAVLLLRELFLSPTAKKPLAMSENYYSPSYIHFSVLRRREQ